MESIQFINKESEKLFFLKEHALIGISPFNSYYSQENLEKLFSWGMSNFKKISVFIPDLISIYTLKAVGYCHDKARKKTHNQDRYLKNKAINALFANKFSENEAKNKIVFLSDISQNNQNYMKLYKLCKEMYKSNAAFREGCLETSKWVLINKDTSGFVSDAALEIAAEYFLAELPFYLNTPNILNTKSSLFVYKDLPSDFLRKIYNNNSSFSSLLFSKQGCLSINFIRGNSL